MATYSLRSERRNGNLFVRIGGELDCGAAQALVAEVAAGDDGRGNVFINVEALGAIAGEGCLLLAREVSRLAALRGRLFLVGEPGLRLGLAHCRVIVPPPKRACCGQCRHAAQGRARTQAPEIRRPESCFGLST
jgi:hypothetical protein